jgi:hypothetical protein
MNNKDIYNRLSSKELSYIGKGYYEDKIYDKAFMIYNNNADIYELANMYRYGY